MHWVEGHPQVARLQTDHRVDSYERTGLPSPAMARLHDFDPLGNRKCQNNAPHPSTRMSSALHIHRY